MDRKGLSRLTTLPGEGPQARPPVEDAVQLVVLVGTNVGQVYKLKRGDTLIGRDEAAEIQILDPGISRRHAQIVFDAVHAVYLLRDLGSRNGVRINDVPVGEPQPLLRGDKIQIGLQTVLRVSYPDELETAYASRMYEAVLRDGLTGAYNRRYLDERLPSEVAFSVRHRVELALLLLDIDHFKAVNDTYGHPAGDVVLKQVAALVQRAIRTEDVLARFGGEEFAIICRQTGEEPAGVLAERIRRGVAETVFVADEHQLRVTVSVGISELLRGGLGDPGAFVEAADRALYQAKRTGRDKVVRFSQTIPPQPGR
ncbi:MAG: GGDEF domain-containing protein [Deltaproteobacteria bacterium]|nr:GGDEF domain-containing protein [Deltaproteobacteria bacterium]